MDFFYTNLLPLSSVDMALGAGAIFLKTYLRAT